MEFKDWDSMFEFRRFLDRPGVEKIAVGRRGGRGVALSSIRSI